MVRVERAHGIISCANTPLQLRIADQSSEVRAEPGLSSGCEKLFGPARASRARETKQLRIELETLSSRDKPTSKKLHTGTWQGLQGPAARVLPAGSQQLAFKPTPFMRRDSELRSAGPGPTLAARATSGGNSYT